jgi:ribosomal protein L16/L10AE
MFRKKKFKKFHKSFLNKKSIILKSYNKLPFDFILICLESKMLDLSQYNNFFRLLSKKVKPFQGEFFFFIKPFFPLTTKPNESRMDSDKGKVNDKIFFLKKGQVFLGIKKLPLYQSYFILSALSYKLPFKSLIVKLPY